jgi:glutamate racemase
LGCTHYPLLAPLIRNLLPPNVRVFEQGPLVAQALSLYLQRHPDLNASLTRGGTIQYFTTEDPQRFDWQASRFGGQHVQSKHIELLEP